MTSIGDLSRPALFTPDALGVPPRRWEWTRLGHILRYTDTEPKRAAILSAIGNAAWRDPGEHADILDSAPARHVIAGLLNHRQLTSAAVVPLPSAGGPGRRLIGLHTATGDRYWLMLIHDGSCVIAVLHDSPGSPANLSVHRAAAQCPAVTDRVRDAAGRLFDAECALHVARQSHLDAWIAAASDRLHDAVLEHHHALAANTAGDPR
jgi:hypothetical protein